MVSQTALKLLDVIHKVFESAITRAKVAALLSLSERQMRRLLKRVRAVGGYGILHNNPGHRLEQEIACET